jgi:hypothetical protein
MKFKA